MGPAGKILAMRVAVIIPVGPGHEEVSEEAVESCFAAARHPAWEISPFVVDDTRGEMGRSHARNVGTREALGEGADWLFYLDADDVMHAGALRALEIAVHVQPDLEAVWGEVWHAFGLYDNSKERRLLQLREERSNKCVAPLEGWPAILANGPFACIHLGMFIKPELFDRVGGWNEWWDLGEDVEFNWACAAHAKSCVKLARRLTTVRLWKASADGRRGYGRLAVGNMEAADLWRDRAGMVGEFWRARDGAPWSKEDRKLRSQGVLYPPTKLWREEPCPTLWSSLESLDRIG